MKERINLVIVAMDDEFSSFLNGLDVPYSEENLLGDKIYVFYKKGVKFVTCKGKIGKSSTSLYLGRLSMIYDIEQIFNLGTAGGVKEGLKVGDIVIASEVMYHDVDVVAFGYPLGQVPGFPLTFKCDERFLNKSLVFDDFKVYEGTISSGDSFITKKNIDNYPIKTIGSYAVEMEAAAVGQCAYQLGIPFVVIRSISDITTANDNEKESTFNIEACSDHCAKVLLKLIELIY